MLGREGGGRGQEEGGRKGGGGRKREEEGRGERRREEERGEGRRDGERGTEEEPVANPEQRSVKARRHEQGGVGVDMQKGAEVGGMQGQEVVGRGRR